MNDKELDRLFSQKLDSMEVAPSGEAWKKLEAGLQHKKQKRLWFYISGVAAALLLLLGTWGAFEYSQQLLPAEQMAGSDYKPSEKQAPAPAQQQQVAQQKSTVETTAETQTKETIEEAAEPFALAQAPAEKEERQRRKSSVRTTVKQQAVPSAETQKQPAVAASLPAVEIESKPLQPQALAVNEKQPAVIEPLHLKEEVVISYRADEEPIAAGAIAQSEAGPEKEKEISARKILGFFKKVTDTSGASLAELREAKNELLSLNRLSRPE